MGFPKENKTLTAHPPTTNFSERDFWRGVIDGDGSLGIRQTGPYLSLTTKSEDLKEAFVKMIETKTGFKMNVHRNQRDDLYNLTITSKKAKIIASWLYEDKPELCLLRKYNKFLEINEYKLKESNRKSWTNEEVEYIKTHTVKEAVEKLGRTDESIRGKIKRLKNKGEWKT